MAFGGPYQISSWSLLSIFLPSLFSPRFSLCLSVSLSLGAFFPVPSGFAVTSVSTGDKGWVWVPGGVGSGQIRGPGHERNFPTFSSRPLWLGSSREGEMSQRGLRAGGVCVGVGMLGFPRAGEFTGAI